MFFIRKKSFYERYIKRTLDIVISLLVVIFLWWLFIIIALIVRTKLGRPVIFKQLRPGMIDCDTEREKLFFIYKFRTMTDEKDEKGELLSDDERLGSFGKMLRATSLDEIPEIFNVLIGDMSIIGPRPQLVKDLVFMNDTQRMRHTSRPGISGLAQVHGRNSISWNEKLNWDLEYINNISFKNDVKIILETIKVAVIRHDGITDGKSSTALDYGDELLTNGEISQTEYERKQKKAKEIIAAYYKRKK